MREASKLTELARRVRRRQLVNLIVEQGAIASALGLSAAALLVVLGTQIMDWYWPAALFAASLVLGLIRVSRRLPSEYALLQGVDHRLELKDALSTAYFFESAGGRPSSNENLRREQRRQAEDVVEELSPRDAAPLVLPRAVGLACMAAVVALSLLGVRYGIRRSLDLRPPMAAALVDIFRYPAELFAAVQQASGAKKAGDRSQETGVALNQAQQDQAAETPLSRTDAPATPYEEGVTPLSTQTAQRRAEEQGDESLFEEDAERGDAAGQPFDPESEQGPTAGDKASAEAPPEGPREEEESSSLLDKMRDAFANMLAKLNIQPPTTGDGKRSPSTAQGGQQSKLSKKGAGQKAPGQGRAEAEGQTSAEAAADQQAQGSGQRSAAEGKDAQQGADSQRQEGNSGIGKEDGNKDLRQAEQLAAMGKISEILGKRAASITGEVMVEVPGGKQNLKTPYSQQQARHGESGGEIHRDEVPLIYQEYVQQYFEEVRKSPPAKEP